MIFNFVVLSDYKNISTTKISGFTVCRNLYVILLLMCNLCVIFELVMLYIYINYSIT